MLSRIRPFPSLSLLALTAALACSGSYSAPSGPSNPNPPPPPGTPNSIVVTNNVFTPENLTVTKGANVTWTWNTCSGGDGYGTPQTCVSHDVVFDDGAQGSGVQSTGTFARTFPTAGTYNYHCSIHGPSMAGKVTVQ